MQDPLIGRQFANFMIERVLGRGGMAQVYFGRDVSLHRPVAIKVIDSRYRDDPAFAARFINEARAIASWRHENIVQVFYADQEDGVYYFVMEYIEGMDLGSLLRQYAQDAELMPHEDVLKIGKAIAHALDYAHSKGVIHRDVKPGNVMISVDDRVVLTDFGLALDVHQGSMGEVFGSPHYIAPEQARRSADAVPASDLYSLGIMLYEMLTGTLPFDDPSPASLALQHLAIAPPSPRSLNPALNAATEQVLLRALSKEPRERYPTAAALINALELALSQPSENLSTAELPPLPAGMNAPSFSNRSIAQRVALHARSTMTEVMPDPPRIPSTAEHQRVSPAPTVILSELSKPAAEDALAASPGTQPAKSRSLFVLIAALIALVAVIGVVALVTSSGSNTQSVTEGLASTTPILAPTDEPSLEPTAQGSLSGAAVNPPTETLQAPTATPVPPTATPEPPTLTPEPPDPEPPTVTPLPPPVTDTPIPQPTIEPPTAAASAVLPTITVLYPNGRRVQFMWDTRSFYWKNLHSESILVTSIRFEAINGDGNPIFFAYDGSRWAGVGYSRVEPNRCTAIEINRAPAWMRPSTCSSYNSIVNTPADSDLVFWIPREGITQFRVLWDGQEVGRCVFSDGVCEVFLP